MNKISDFSVDLYGKGYAAETAVKELLSIYV